MGGVLSSSSQVGVGIDMSEAGAEGQLGVTCHFAGRGRTKPEEIPKAAGSGDSERCGPSAKSQAQRLKREIATSVFGTSAPYQGHRNLARGLWYLGNCIARLASAYCRYGIPILCRFSQVQSAEARAIQTGGICRRGIRGEKGGAFRTIDRKSTRLNSSHLGI